VKGSRPLSPNNEQPVQVAHAATGAGDVQNYKRDFWAVENRDYEVPHFRMRKLAREVRRIAHGRECDLLDIGCGPGSLESLLPPEVHYHGIDIAISPPAPNLLEMDILAAPISFLGKTFDVIVAQGLFEYLGAFQSQKLAEIAGLMNPDGTFIVTYQNFAHRKKHIYEPYSNVQQPEEFRADLNRYFEVNRRYPGAHNWNHSMPNRWFVTAPQAHLNVYVPVISPILAVDYFYVCTPRRST
jgi:cyclopropane fatty-acyl-phospholipid synthase-like methyltransferase